MKNGSVPPGKAPADRMAEVVLGIADLLYAAVFFFFWMGMVLVLLHMPSEKTRTRVAEMDRGFRKKLLKLDSEFDERLSNAGGIMAEARIKKQYAARLSELPLVDRMPVYETFTQGGVYYPSLFLTVFAVIGNVILLLVSIFCVSRRPFALPWLRRVVYGKLCVIVLWLVMFFIFTLGPLMEMFSCVEAAYEKIYFDRGLENFIEGLNISGMFWWVFAAFLALMLLWPLGTIVVLALYRKAAARKKCLPEI